MEAQSCAAYSAYGDGGRGSVHAQGERKTGAMSSMLSPGKQSQLLTSGK